MVRNSKNGSTSPRPKRRRGLVGIQPRFRGGRWVWRAVCKIDGRKVVGPQREDQELAHRDYLGLRLQGQQAPTVLTTLGDGLAAVVAHKEKLGTSERSIASVRTYCRALLAAWHEDSPLRQVATAEELNWYVRTALANGRSADTIKSKDLATLRLALRLAGIDWPEGVRRVKSARRPMAYFEAAEVVALIERVRTEQFYYSDGRRKPLRGRQRAADLFELIVCTGLRLGEVARLEVADVNLERRELRVVNHKDHGSVALVPFPDTLDPALRRLCELADGHGRLFSGGENSLTTVFDRWKRRLDEPRLSARALRHTHVTLALADTGDPAAAREAGRHRSLETTSRYVHEISSRKAKRLAGLAARFRRPDDQTPAAG